MSALDALLGPRPGPPVVSNSPRTLLFDGGEKLYLQEDDALENIVVFSRPGDVESLDWLAGQTDPWRVTARHPRHDRVSSTLAVEPGTGRVYIADAWPRALFDSAGLAALLTDHLARHRAWQHALAAADGRDAR